MAFSELPREWGGKSVAVPATAAGHFHSASVHLDHSGADSSTRSPLRQEVDT